MYFFKSCAVSFKPPTVSSKSPILIFLLVYFLLAALVPDGFVLVSLMSFHYPRRLKDLPALKQDYGDEQSTAQERKKQANNEDIKENAEATNSIAGNSLRIYPKRSSELPKLDSDSDELDDSLKIDNLNCAILNDSFILSPCKNEQNESLVCETPAGKLMRKVSGADKDEASPNLSFVSQFNKLDIKAGKNASPEVTKDENIPSESDNREICAKSDKNNPLEIKQERKQPLADGLNIQNSIMHSKRKVLDTPYKPKSSSSIAASSSSIVKGPINTSDAQFATPQIRTFSVQRRPRDLCSTQSQKSRNAIVNESRSQKVLFQTPIALSRIPLACLPNDSVTLSICDSINESGNTPSTVEKSQDENESKASGKTKKSLESAFIATEHGKEDMNKQTSATEQANPTQHQSPKNMNQSKQPTIMINNLEYAVVKKLGCGGSSSVYLAKCLKSERECALKVVDLRGDPMVVEGYMNETKLLAKLQGNLCVVSLYDYQLLQKESKLFMVMEKGDSDLQKILHSYATNLPLYVLMSYLYQMLQAVNYIHQNGVIHSDLKPANFLMVSGRLKLIDFGIASNIAHDSTSIIKFSQAGTFNYISPEALIDTSSGSSPMRNNQPKIKISTKSDVWSLGCILYLFLYKKTPFSHIKNIYAKINAITNPATVIEFPSMPSYYPIMLVHMVKNCLQHNPKKRPSCAEILEYPFHMIIPVQNFTVPMRVSTTTKQTQL